MLMQPISPISINVIINLPKYTLNIIAHTTHKNKTFLIPGGGWGVGGWGGGGGGGGGGVGGVGGL